MSTTGFMTSKDQAKGLVALLEQAKKEAVKDREVQEAGMTKVMESIDITARGTEVQLRVKISAYQVGKMAERLFDELAKSK
jgi:hypothetical protein